MEHHEIDHTDSTFIFILGSTQETRPIQEENFKLSHYPIAGDRKFDYNCGNLS